VSDETDTRSRLREVALERFGRDGIQATSTRSILQAAGLRNPSAINYHFGSKAGLVSDLVGELREVAWPVVRLQVDLAASGTPTIEEWADVAATSAAKLVSNERGWLMARVLWEHDTILAPDAFEEFLGSDDPLARAWQDAIAVTFASQLPNVVAVARNFLSVHTMEWLLARYAARMLSGRPKPAITVKYPDDLRDALYEISMALFTGPSRFTAETLTFE
jgi:AcrR family transcriptional regulator